MATPPVLSSGVVVFGATDRGVTGYVGVKAVEYVFVFVGGGDPLTQGVEPVLDVVLVDFSGKVVVQHDEHAVNVFIHRGVLP